MSNRYGKESQNASSDVASGDGALLELKERLFARELDLQDFLTKHPALLAGE